MENASNNCSCKKLEAAEKLIEQLTDCLGYLPLGDWREKTIEALAAVKAWKEGV